MLPRDKLFDPAQSIEGHVPELDDGGIAVGSHCNIQLFAEEHEHFTQLLAVNTEVLLETSRGKSNESFLMDELQALRGTSKALAAIS